MKAIETAYKGYRFRSRLEARWAVFFDALGIPWQYEVEGIECRNGIRYLPDFWLPDWDIYLEIKPTLPEVHRFGTPEKEPCFEGIRIYSEDGNPTPTGKWWFACEELVEQKEDHCKPRLYMLCGVPGVPNLQTENNRWKLRDGSIALHRMMVPQSNFIQIWAWCESSGMLDLNSYYREGASTVVQSGTNHALMFPSGFMQCLYVGTGRDYSSKLLKRAYAAARCARFEHGERPK